MRCFISDSDIDNLSNVASVNEFLMKGKYQGNPRKEDNWRILYVNSVFVSENWAILWMPCHSTASVCGYITRHLVKAKAQIVRS